MACGCQKNQTNANVQVDRHARAVANAEREEAARAATSTRRLTPEPARGTVQSFALRTEDGRVQTFGSNLEARAERIRRGGTLLG